MNEWLLPPEVTVFADTNLGTRIAFNAPLAITAGALKRDFEKVHSTCLPDIGEIKVNGLMVKRKKCFYYLPDSLPIKYAFPEMRETWFLHVEVRHQDAVIPSKYQDLMTCNCENKATFNGEQKRMEGFYYRAYFLEEHEATKHDLKKQKENPLENHMQDATSRMLERYSSRFGDKLTGVTNKSQYVMPENKVENRVELHANSMQGSFSKMSTQVISVTGIINKYFSGFNGVDNISSSSNSDVTSRAAHNEIEVQSNYRSHSCSKRRIDSLPQFTPKTPPHVLHASMHVDKVSEKSRGKKRRSHVGKRLLVASQSLGVSITKQSPTLSFCRSKDQKLLKDKSQIKGSIFSISDSDD